MRESGWKWWRELLSGSDVKRAAKIEADTLKQAAKGTLHPDFVAEQTALERSPQDALVVGAFTEGPWRDRDFLVRLESLLTHELGQGANGSGKSYFLLLKFMALLRRGYLTSALIEDPKGETVQLLTDVLLPAFAAELPAAEADRFLKRIVVIDPFSPTHLPPLNVLVRDPGVPIEIQARDVAECFQTATEADVSMRMETVLDWVLRLVIEVGGSFLTVRRALQEPQVLEGLVRQSKDADVVRYFVTRFPSEPKASKLALLARLDRFLALPMTQLSVGAKVCLDFDQLLHDRITILSLGRAPAGLSSVARFFAMVVMTRYVRAIFRRPPRSQHFHSLIVADEWQITLNSALANEFESILTLARSRGVHLWLANQQLAQLDRHGSALRSVVLGQVANQVLFRLAPEDATTFRALLPSTGTVRRRQGFGQTGTPFLSASEEREARVAAASRLPDRVGYWCDRRKSWGAVPFRSATLPLPKTSTLPADYVRRAREGALVFTVADLTQMKDDENRRLDALAAGPARPPPVNVSPAPAPAPPSTTTLLGATQGPAPAKVRRGKRGAGGP